MTAPWLAIVGVAVVIAAVFLVWGSVGLIRVLFDRRFPGRRRQLGISNRRFVDIASPFRRSAQVSTMLTAAENSFLRGAIRPALSAWAIVSILGIGLVVAASG